VKGFVSLNKNTKKLICLFGTILLAQNPTWASEVDPLVIDIEAMSPEGAAHATSIIYEHRGKSFTSNKNSFPESLVDDLRKAVLASQTKAQLELADFGISESSVLASRNTMIYSAYKSLMKERGIKRTFEQLPPNLQKLFEYETVAKAARAEITGAQNSAYLCIRISIPGDTNIVLMSHHRQGGFLPWRVIVGEKTWQTYSREISNLLAKIDGGSVFSGDAPDHKFTYSSEHRGTTAYWPQSFFQDYGYWSADIIESFEDMEQAKKIPGWEQASKIVRLEDALVCTNGDIRVQVNLREPTALVDRVRWIRTLDKKNSQALHDWNEFLSWMPNIEKAATSTTWLKSWKMAGPNRSIMAVHDNSGSIELNDGTQRRKEWDIIGLPQNAEYKLQLYKDGTNTGEALISPPYSLSLIVGPRHEADSTLSASPMMPQRTTPLRTLSDESEQLADRACSIIDQTGKSFPTAAPVRHVPYHGGFTAPSAEDPPYDYSWPVDFNAQEDLEYLLKNIPGETIESLAPPALNKSIGWGAITRDGQTLIGEKYRHIGAFSDGLAAVTSLDGKGGYLNTSGKVVIPLEYDNALDFHQGLAAVCKNDRWGFIDTKGNIAIPLIFDSVKRFSEGLAGVRLGAKFGYIDKTGKTVITPQFSRARHFVNGLAYVQLDGKRAYIDHSGKPIGGKFYDELDRFAEDHAVFREGGGTTAKFGYIDRAGSQVIPAKYDEARAFRNGIAEVSINGERKAIDFNGQIVPARPQHSDFWDGPLSDSPVRASRSDSCLIGFKDSHTGKWIIEPKYSSAGVFAEGLCPVEMNGKWGAIDEHGNLLIKCQFEEMGQIFREHRIAVKTADHWGVIDSTGKLIVQPKYESVSSFEGGTAVMQEGSKFGLLGDSGKILVQAKFDVIQRFDQSGIARVGFFIDRPQSVVLP
jgi:hypothetical protein